VTTGYANNAVRDKILLTINAWLSRPEQNIGTRYLKNKTQLSRILANIPTLNNLEACYCHQVSHKCQCGTRQWQLPDYSG